MEERITAVKKSSLAGLSEGWGDECCAIVRPATYPDMVAVDALDPKNKKANAEFQSQFVRDHFISGKIKVWKADGSQELVEMTADDVDCSVEVLDRLFADIIGIDVDPKDLREAVAQMMQPEEDANTDASSSTINTTTSTSTSVES